MVNDPRSLNRLIGAIAAVDPSFSTEIEGASQQEIDTYESLCRHPFPPAYREYLELMGHKDGGILSRVEIHTDVPYLDMFYRRVILGGKEKIPDDCILVAVGGMSIENFYIQVGSGHVWEGGMRKEVVWAKSFEGLLHSNAFYYTMGVRMSEVSYVVASGTQIVEAAREEALRDRFVLEWFSDDQTICAVSPDAKLYVSQRSDDSPMIRVVSRDPGRGDHLVERIAARTGLVFKRHVTTRSPP